MVDWDGHEAYKSDVRKYFICCPICGNTRLSITVVSGGTDTLTCKDCDCMWHLNIGLFGFKRAELDVQGKNGLGSELVGRRLKGKEIKKLAQEARKNPINFDNEIGDKKQTDKTIIVKEIVKIRCPYCKALYDESKDRCPHCNGSR